MRFKDRTAGGREFRIYAEDGSAPYPLHGAVRDDKGAWDITTWSWNGLENYAFSGANDLVLDPEYQYHSIDQLEKRYPKRIEALS